MGNLKIYTAAMLALILNFSGCSEKKAAYNNSEIKRIVSLSPSITKQIIDLEAQSMLAGITSYCPEIKGAVIVGNLTNPVSEIIMKLKPDIILSSEEDSAVQKLSALENSGLRVYKFRKNNSFDDIIANYRELGRLIGRETISSDKSENYILKRNKLKADSMNLKAAFFVSHRPLIAASSKAFINGILNDAGLMNIYTGLNVPYPIISIETIVKNNPDYIFSMDTTPVSFFTDQLGKFNLVALRNKRIFYLDPDHISSYTPGDYISALIEIKVLTGSEK